MASNMSLLIMKFKNTVMITDWCYIHKILSVMLAAECHIFFYVILLACHPFLESFSSLSKISVCAHK